MQGNQQNNQPAPKYYKYLFFGTAILGLFILIVACIFNVMNKFIHKLSLNDELESSATYVNQQNQEEDKNLDK
jgi:hypothetical protein